MSRGELIAMAAAFFVSAGLVAAGPDPRLDATAAYLAEHATVYAGERELDADFGEKWAEIMKRPDPGTSFESFVFAIERRRSKLLSAEQSAAWEVMMAEHAAPKNRFHDERNSVRVQALAGEWELAAASDEAEAARIERELDRWIELHLAYVFQEEMVHQRFRRAAWEILSEDQRAAILRGQWDEYVTKSTGHLRAYSANKIVVRALGKPDFPEAFEALSLKQAETHGAINAAYTEAATRWRRMGFAMDVNSEAMLVAEWPRYEGAFRDFLVAQGRDLRALVQAGYDLSIAERREAIEEAQRGIHTDARKKYGEKAAALHRVLYREE